MTSKIYDMNPDGCQTPFRIINDSSLIVFDTAYHPYLYNPSIDFRCLINRISGMFHYEGNQMIIVFGESHFEREYKSSPDATLDYQIFSSQGDTIRVTRLAQP